MAGRGIGFSKIESFRKDMLQSILLSRNTEFTKTNYKNITNKKLIDDLKIYFFYFIALLIFENGI